MDLMRSDLLAILVLSSHNHGWAFSGKAVQCFTLSFMCLISVLIKSVTSGITYKPACGRHGVACCTLWLSTYMYTLSKTTDCDDWLKHVSDLAGCAGPWQQVALLQFTLPVYMSACIPGLQMCSSRCPAHCVSDRLSANLHCHGSLETLNPAAKL